MTEAERDRLTDEWFAAHLDLWDAWNALPVAEQAANLEKVNAAGDVGGPPAARAMARALGLPMPPEGLADPDDVLIARRAERDERMRDLLAGTKLTQAEIDDRLQPQSSGRVDH